MDLFLNALSQAYTPEGILAVILGVLAGIILGALPGISTNMAITLLFPFAYVVEGVPGINMLLGVYCGSIYGGSISAILLNTPGTPGSAATMIDGYPMAHDLGQPGRAPPWPRPSPRWNTVRLPSSASASSPRSPTSPLPRA